MPVRNLEVIGHRGNVFLHPENTIAGFQSLVDIGADALELDLVISVDKKVVISHEPFMAAKYMLHPDGKRITKEEENRFLLFSLPYETIKSFIISNNSNFPLYKPLLEDVFINMENKLKESTKLSFRYYLEIKSTPKAYGISQPYPNEFADLVIKTVRKFNLEKKVIIKSFDLEILMEIRKNFPEIKVSYLLKNITQKVIFDTYRFHPDVVSPYFKELKTTEDVLQFQRQHIKVIPWTVTAPKDIKKMINLGVDGIISDDPARVMQLRSKLA